MFVQAGAGLILAAFVAAAAYRLHALTPSGALAATAVGTLTFAAGGVAWSALLLAFFVTSSALSRFHRDSRNVAAKGGCRDALQVVANGGLPALLAAAALLVPGPNWFIPYAGALAAATGDTWATEIGRMSRAEPRLITNGRGVRPGTSGGITFLGLAGAAIGASGIAGTAALAGFEPAAGAILVAGIFGSLADSILGATVQEIRRCPVCLAATEQIHHIGCGAETEVVGGIPGLNNDGVNALTSAIGAITAVLVATLTGGA